MNILNYTPHAIVLRCRVTSIDPADDRGTRDVTYPSRGRAVVHTADPVDYGSYTVLTDDDPDGAHVHLAIAMAGLSRQGDILGLPASVGDDDIVVVSAVVLARARELLNRIVIDDDDARVLRRLASPGTGPSDGAIRENGQVVAVTRLIRVQASTLVERERHQRPR